MLSILIVSSNLSFFRFWCQLNTRRINNCSVLYTVASAILNSRDYKGRKYLVINEKYRIYVMRAYEWQCKKRLKCMTEYQCFRLLLAMLVNARCCFFSLFFHQPHAQSILTLARTSHPSLDGQCSVAAFPRAQSVFVSRSKLQHQSFCVI